MKKRYHLLTEIAEFHLDKTEESEIPISVICALCRNRVGYMIPKETDLPLRGNMIRPHRGCEHWPLPAPGAGPNDFVCPHAWDGDLHLFVNTVEGEAELTDWFLTEDGSTFQVTKSRGECPCGCGDKVRGTNKYASGLVCYRKHIAQTKAEIEDGNN